MNTYDLKDKHFTMNPLHLGALDDLVRNGWIDAVHFEESEGKASREMKNLLKPFKGDVENVENGHYVVITPIILNGRITAHEIILYKIHPLGSPCKYDTAQWRNKWK
jgi:hypothetical protein